MGAKFHLVCLVLYPLCGVGFYVGASRLLSRRTKKKNMAKRVALIAAVGLTLLGLFMSTWMYIYYLNLNEAIYATSV